MGRGLVLTYAPRIAKGAVLEWLKSVGFGFQIATEMVANNVSIWDMMEPTIQERLRTGAKKLGSFDFATSDWFIDAITNTYPDVASLFLGDDQARTYLDTQMEKLRKEVLA